MGHSRKTRLWWRITTVAFLTPLLMAANSTCGVSADPGDPCGVQPMLQKCSGQTLTVKLEARWDADFREQPSNNNTKNASFDVYAPDGKPRSEDFDSHSVARTWKATYSAIPAKYPVTAEVTFVHGYIGASPVHVHCRITITRSDGSTAAAVRHESADGNVKCGTTVVR